MPTSFSEPTSSTVTKLWLWPCGCVPHHCGWSVLATRSLPSCSDSENWLSRKPLTLPLPAYSVRCVLETSKAWICVVIGGGLGSSVVCGGSHRRLAT